MNGSSDIQLTPRRILETNTILGLACLVVGILSHKTPWFYGSAALLIIGLFIPALGKWIAFSWLKFGQVLGAINSKILLGLVYYLFLTPLAFVFRLVKGDFFRLKKDEGPKRSYWIDRNHTYKKDDFEKIW